MALRLYLPTTGTPSVSPAYSANWEDTSIASRLTAVATKIYSTKSSFPFTDSDNTDKDILYRQYVFGPVAAQTIAAQTFKAQIQAYEYGSANNLAVAISVRSWNGSTFQTLLSLTRDDLELATSQLTNRSFSATTTARTVSAGDYIVIEIGFGGDPTPSGDHSGRMAFGDSQATDLPENDTETINYSPWIEFANDIPLASGYSLTCDVGSFTLDGQAAALLAARSFACDYGSIALAGQDVTLTYTPVSGYDLTCDLGSLTLDGQSAALLAARSLACDYASTTLAGQDVTLTYTPAIGYDLTCDVGGFTLDAQAAALLATRSLACDYASTALAGQDIAFHRGFYLNTYYRLLFIQDKDVYLIYAGILPADHATFTLAGQDCTLTYEAPGDYPLVADTGYFVLSLKSANLYYGLWEPSADMITLGTLLTRIQTALGDTTGAVWHRTDVVWPFAVEAIRNFPILRPKTIVHTLTEAGHSFTLPEDFRKVIYVEFPLFEDPPSYLARKSHLGNFFYGEDGFYDVDRDYDEGEGYIMWLSNDLAVDDVVTVRYLAMHTVDFANEYSYITVENQHVAVLIAHAVYMCYQERLSAQLQDPTAHTSTIQQMTESAKTAEIAYQNQLNRVLEDVSSSQRIEGWKVDKHDRIY